MTRRLWPSEIPFRYALAIFALTNGLFLLLQPILESRGDILAGLLLFVLALCGWIFVFWRQYFWRKLARLHLTHSVLLFLLANCLLFFVRPTIESSTQLLLGAVIRILVAPLGWGLLLARVARRLRWSPRTCYFVPMVLFMAAQFALWIVNSALSVYAYGMFIGICCSKIAYPELPWKLRFEPEPPTTLFTGHSGA